MRARFLWLAVTAVACGGAPRVRTAGAYRFRCEPADARVIVDEAELGPCALWTTRALALPAGLHRVRVVREGWLPMESEVTPAGGVVTVTARLRRAPD